MIKMDQFKGVDFWTFSSNIVGGDHRQLVNRLNFGSSPSCSFFHAFQDVENPVVPDLIAGDLQQQSVIVLPCCE